MELINVPRRVQIGIVLAGYAGVLILSVVWVTARYLAEQSDPATFSGGMAAGGDWILELIIVGMFLVPTFALALIIRDSEAAYTKFAKVLLGFAVALPVSIGLMAIPIIGQTNKLPWSLLGSLCFYRLFAFPVTVVGFVGCWVLAKFKRPRRLIVYSLGIEIASIVLMMFALTTMK